MRHLQLRLCRENLGGQRTLVGHGVIDIGSLAGGRAQQRLGARKLNVGVGEARAGVRDRSFLLLHGGFERSALQSVKQVALLDLCPLGEQALVEESSDARGKGYPLDRLHASDELGCFCDSRLLGTDDTD